jgi:hypothetical protein
MLFRLALSTGELGAKVGANSNDVALPDQAHVAFSQSQNGRGAFHPVKSTIDGDASLPGAGSKKCVPRPRRPVPN